MKDREIKAGLYGRISSNPEHDEVKVRDQIAKLREMIDRRGGVIVMERTDDDISATYGRDRPGYRELMRAAEAGEINAIGVWQSSRWWRNRKERVDGIERLQKAGVILLVAKGPDLEFDTSYGRAMAVMSGEMDTWESEVKSERVKEEALKIALAGRIAAGGPRPFGFRRIFEGEGDARRIVRDELEPAEADAVREMAKRFLAGESLRSLVTDLNQRGIPTSTGRKFTMQGLRIILKSARIAGLREHGGQIVATAVWPAIVDEETHRALRAKLDGRLRPPGSRVRVHFLSGLVRCQRCDTKMKTTGTHGKPKYGCPADEGCGGMIISRPDLEEFVGHYVVARLDSDAFRAEVAKRTKLASDKGDEIGQQLLEAEQRVTVLGQSLSAAGVADIPEAVTALKEARAQVDRLREQRDRLAAIPGTVSQNMGLGFDEFMAMPLHAKRELLAFLVEKIVIGPARRGVGKFDAQRVDIVPR